MSTAILPDDSVVIRLPRETIHLDAKTRAIHVRAAHSGRDLGGSVLASYPLTAVDRVRMTTTNEGRFRLVLELRSGTTIALGEAPTQDVGMRTARVVADLTRCKVEVSGGMQPLPAGRESRGGLGDLEEPTGRLHWEEATLPTTAADEKPEGWTPEASATAPWAKAAFGGASGEGVVVVRGEPLRAPSRTTEGPVFLDLLRESQFLAPVMPTALDEDAPDQQATQLGVGGWGQRSTSSSRLRAVFEMLRLMSEHLPVASESVPGV